VESSTLRLSGRRRGGATYQRTALGVSIRIYITLLVGAARFVWWQSLTRLEVWLDLADATRVSSLWHHDADADWKLFVYVLNVSPRLVGRLRLRIAFSVVLALGSDRAVTRAF